MNEIDMIATGAFNQHWHLDTHFPCFKTHVEEIIISMLILKEKTGFITSFSNKAVRMCKELNKKVGH